MEFWQQDLGSSTLLDCLTSSNLLPYGSMLKKPIIRKGIGQDSHRFLSQESTKLCVLGGLILKEVRGFLANSDGDVIFHALCNAISSLTGVIILGKKHEPIQ